ncbi:hypothetical protein IQ37_17260 [Chryseobacterium piperi]|uniref:DUF4145 domain-containing protein n=1 Tax=Chryseobacterium piperi TaxID=558152 RepID=A0A086AKL8_9FLAO|nr:hypothetical protein [Chryseobacterium piperi]ASW75972.1 hypothetical protein CJF12_17990 [Chryseobacterium piperi]KFF17232.1 hypothetical protein IQ37_17260 [Chryseobacterium piperi]
MNTDELIVKIQEIDNILPKNSKEWTNSICYSFFITTIQFVKNYVGENTEFYKALYEANKNQYTDSENKKAWIAKEVLKSLKDYLNLDLDLFASEKYNIKIDIISDFMRQAIDLANDKKFHPAASAILMGASLEEYLKELAEKEKVNLDGIKMTIDPISKKIYEEEIINKQDLKDITSWAGIRNEATHGNFDEVNDRKRILNAIEGVNLFMRKYN